MLDVATPSTSQPRAYAGKARLERIDRHFARYVDTGKLPGWLITVSRHGKLAHVAAYGHRDVEAGLPVQPDTLWRIYSMTKPITPVAAMMLYEEVTSNTAPEATTCPRGRRRPMKIAALNAITSAEATSFGLVTSESVPLDPDKPRA